MQTVEEVFGEVISSYSRAQAIADGELVDVTETARRACKDIPHTVLTRSVYGELEDEADFAERAGRALDNPLEELVISMVAAGWDAVLGRLPVDEIRSGDEPGDRIEFHATCSTEYSIHFGPADDATPVLTIMQIDED